MIVQTLHDQIVRDLERRLRKYEPEALIKTFMFYPGGEIDLFMLLNDQVHNYEVKRSNHQKSRVKTNDQLLRAKNYWIDQGQKNVWSYYVHGDAGWVYSVELVNNFNPLSGKVIGSYKIGRGF